MNKTSQSRREPNIRVTPAPPYRPSAMPTEHRLFLRALQGLRNGEAIRLYCDDSEDTSVLAKVIGNWVYRERKKGRLNHHFHVLKREEGESLVVYVVKGDSQGK